MWVGFSLEVKVVHNLAVRSSLSSSAQDLDTWAVLWLRIAYIEIRREVRSISRFDQGESLNDAAEKAYARAMVRVLEPWQNAIEKRGLFVPKPPIKLFCQLFNDFADEGVYHLETAIASSRERGPLSVSH